MAKAQQKARGRPPKGEETMVQFSQRWALDQVEAADRIAADLTKTDHLGRKIGRGDVLRMLVAEALAARAKVKRK